MIVRVPVRRGHGPLHLSEPTGRGYRTECGMTLEGMNLTVPMPKLNLGQKHVEAHWARCWRHERVCKRCEKRSESL
jgi:hypothetical protein